MFSLLMRRRHMNDRDLILTIQKEFSENQRDLKALMGQTNDLMNKMIEVQTLQAVDTKYRDKMSSQIKALEDQVIDLKVNQGKRGTDIGNNKRFSWLIITTIIITATGVMSKLK